LRKAISKSMVLETRGILMKALTQILQAEMLTLTNPSSN
jgi:hypothetical protein